MSPGGSEWPATARAAQRFLLSALPDVAPVETQPVEIERYSGDEPPLLIEPRVIEGSAFSARRVAPPDSLRSASGFGGFLDGTQDVSVVLQQHGIPVLFATVSAAVRVRNDRRLVTWPLRSPIVRSRLYFPFRYMEQLPASIRNHPHCVDTVPPSWTGPLPSRHPAALMEAAIRRVRQDRERAEQELAEAWCSEAGATLYVDGGISASPSVAASRAAIGVVKSHRQLYAEGDAFRVLVNLRAGERSSVFSITSGTRATVASWYLRVREATGADALFGLVRVEAAYGEDLTERADEVSRWILSEGAPLALPDSRWDKMAYGVRDTEQFLRAIS